MADPIAGGPHPAAPSHPAIGTTPYLPAGDPPLAWQERRQALQQLHASPSAWLAAAAMTLCIVLTAWDAATASPGGGLWTAVVREVPLLFGGVWLWVLFVRARLDRPPSKALAYLALALLLLPLLCQALPACLHDGLRYARETEPTRRRVYALLAVQALARLALLLVWLLYLALSLRGARQWRGAGSLPFAVLCFVSASLSGLAVFLDHGHVNGLYVAARVCAMLAYLLAGFYLLRCRRIVRS